MKKFLGIIILFVVAGTGVYAQRNMIHFLGIDYENCMKANEGIKTAESNVALHFAYERTFGDYLSLGVNFVLPFSAFSKKDQYFLSAYDEGNPNSPIYSCNNYSEYHRWGISYNSKFFVTSFDEEAEGFFIAPVIGYDSYALNMQGNLVQYYANGYPIGDVVYLNDVNKTYGVMRYGFKLGIQGAAGELFLGYTFNSVMGRNDDLPFGLGTPINSSSISIGYNWGVTF